MNHFDYIFEELPLVTASGIDACLVSGEAEIHYDRSGIWEVHDVHVDGYHGGKHVMTAVPVVIHTMIVERLYGAWHDRVQEAVAEQIELDRERAADERADMIRERRYEPD